MNEKLLSKNEYYSEKYGTIRTIYDIENNQALFCAKDVAKVFGYRNPSASIRNICLNCRKESHMTNGGLQVLNFIGWDDIARLYHHCRNQESYPYIEYLCNLESDMYDEAENELLSCEDEDLKDDYCGCPFCDIEKYGCESEFCIHQCFECEYNDICPDFCPEDCDTCPYRDECISEDEETVTEDYEDTHNPDFIKLIEKNNPENCKFNWDEIVTTFFDILCEYSETFRKHYIEIGMEYVKNFISDKDDTDGKVKKA